MSMNHEKTNSSSDNSSFEDNRNNLRIETNKTITLIILLIKNLICMIWFTQFDMISQ